ncbi:MAG: BrnT family toxin [Longimicrobiales bacterium]
MEFEWDPAKEAKNLEKHGISFVAAARVLERGITFHSRSDHDGEQRWVAIGMHPESGKVIAVVYAMRDGRHRVISARRARTHEQAEFRKQVERAAAEGSRG